MKNLDYHLEKNCDGTYKLIYEDGLKRIFPIKENFLHFDQQCSVSKNLISSIYVPDGVVGIEDATFEGFTSMESIRLPTSLEMIKSGAFEKCFSLKSITIPPNVTKIYDETFRYCGSLKEVDIQGDVIVIGREAFSHCTNLQKINLPGSLRELHLQCFYDCQSLESIDFPDGLELIGSQAFKNCQKLKNAIIPNTVQRIKDEAFSNCFSLSNVILPEKLNIIDSGVFMRCGNLQQINIPDSITCIGPSAFSDCLNLKEIAFAGKEIEVQAFYGCSNLKKVIFQQPVYQLKNRAFMNCENLDTIEGVIQYLHFGAFTNCKKIDRVYIQRGTIGNSVYINCPDVAIPFDNIYAVELSKKMDNALFFYKIEGNDFIWNSDPDFYLKGATSFESVFSFIKEPTYEHLLSVEEIEDRAFLAVYFDGEGFQDYARRHLSQLLDYVGKTEDYDTLSVMIEKKIITKRNLDKCLKLIEKENYHEVFLTLVQLKNEFGGYKPKNRFDL